jgi:hypothetical protein
MAKTTKTHIFCFDDYRSFSEDVKKRFSDDTRYKVVSFLTRQEFVRHLEEDKEYALCKVAILGVHDTKEHIEMIDQLSMEIIKIDQKTGIILLIPVEKMNDVKKTVIHNIDAYIPRNANSILRIHNTVKKLISENGIIRFRKQRNFSLYILLIFIILSLLFVVFAWIKLPEYF